MSEDESESLVYAFADTVAEHSEPILDASWLPASHKLLHEAFAVFIRRYERLQSINPAFFQQCGDDQRLNLARALSVRINDFKVIEPADVLLVTDINQKWPPIMLRVNSGTNSQADQDWLGTAMHTILKYQLR